jgi:glycosyltransferase involved in cell wall biosynthesis
MNIGGIELFLMNVLRHSNYEKFEIAILTYRKEIFDLEAEINKMGIKIYKIDNPANVSPIRHFRQLLAIIKVYKPDVIISHTYFNSVFVLLAGLVNGVKIRVSHSHTSMANSSFRMNKVFKYFVSRIIINTVATMRLACSEEAGVALYKDSSFKIIPNGIEISKFKFKELYRSQIRKELEIDNKSTVIGHIGRFAKPKNHEFLLKVFYEYQLNNSDSFLVLVGDGPEKQYIKTLAKALGIDTKVKYLGIRKDIEKILSSMDIFVFPSLYEGLPVSLIEAQANSINILASDTISREVKLSDSLCFFSLNEGSKEWAMKLANIVLIPRNFNDETNIKKYDVANTTRLLEKVYLGNSLEDCL